jgi:hypothetical protein
MLQPQYKSLRASQFIFWFVSHLSDYTCNKHYKGSKDGLLHFKVTI